MLIIRAYTLAFLFVWCLGFPIKLYAVPFQQPLNGKYEERYANGKPKESGRYRSGQKTGIWFFYDEKGKLSKKEKWIKGELQWQMFIENGKIIRTIDKKGNIVDRPACGC